MDIAVLNELQRQLASAMAANLGRLDITSVVVYYYPFIQRKIPFGRVLMFELFAVTADTPFDETVDLNLCDYYKIYVYLDKKVAQAVEGYTGAVNYTINLVY